MPEYKTQADIEKAYDSLIRRRERLDKDRNDFEEAIQGICTHTKIHTYEIDCDNGYGKWWKKKQNYCLMCRKENV